MSISEEVVLGGWPSSASAADDQPIRGGVATEDNILSDKSGAMERSVLLATSKTCFMVRAQRSRLWTDSTCTLWINDKNHIYMQSG